MNRVFIPPGFECFDARDEDGGKLVCFFDQVGEPFGFDDACIGKEFKPIQGFLQLLQGPRSC